MIIESKRKLRRAKRSNTKLGLGLTEAELQQMSSKELDTIINKGRRQTKQNNKNLWFLEEIYKTIGQELPENPDVDTLITENRHQYDVRVAAWCKILVANTELVETLTHKQLCKHFEEYVPTQAISWVRKNVLGQNKQDMEAKNQQMAKDYAFMTNTELLAKYPDACMNNVYKAFVKMYGMSKTEYRNQIVEDYKTMTKEQLEAKYDMIDINQVQDDFKRKYGVMKSQYKGTENA